MDNYYSDFKVNKEYLPEAICIDELKSVKNIEGAISFIFRDYQRKSIIDIVKGSKDKVDYLLEKSPELENIKILFKQLDIITLKDLKI